MDKNNDSVRGAGGSGAATILLALWGPSLVWLWMSFKPPAALALTATFAFLLFWSCRRAALQVERYKPVGAGPWAAIVVYSMVWSAFTALPHIFTINYDWLTRLESLNQFTKHPWQVLPSDDRTYLFRFPGAYYAAAALFADVLGIHVLRGLLWIATGISCAIALLGLFRRLRVRKVVSFLLVFTCINGFDVLGTALLELVRGGVFPPFGTHIEWWSGYQFSGLTTAMVWVPNHLLPALLFCALLPLSRDDDEPTVERLMLLSVAAVGTILWSPLVFAGTLPLLAAELFRVLKFTPLRVAIAKVKWPVAGLLLVGTLAICWYITLETGAIRKGLYLDSCSVGFVKCSGRLVLFYLLEAVPLAVLCLLLPNRALGAASALTLLTLPLVVYGPNNDLLMRASLPAIIIAAFAFASYLAQEANASRRHLAFALLLVAGYSSASELWRGVKGFSQPAWQPIGVLEAFKEYFPNSLTNGYPNHYMIPIDKACSGYRSELLRGCP